ncbi:alpha/beta fold hydrolase [Actinophytocola oryzae]|uniref:Pimeloyl-ACP methyl ester carboxylesterase n=1 Tax=Actinophytocola oryzae TaxID=502181 RepID=A0A4R7VDW7_9PSEU|nr:alpha/beta hydrolase [Actinophytocola oryzae]TDV47189.1 pimeloyl-ACP methyl ester carboxylesterase [Actinophytocola oryzae]
MTVSKKVGALVGTAIAVGIAGTAVAVGVARNRRHPPAGDGLGELRPDREYTVITEDGIELSVEEVDPADGGRPELTVVFVHGFALDRRSWHFQRRALSRLTEPRVRQVLYDQRSHGRSGRANEQSSTIDQLGRDLAEVLTTVDGPVVLVGHSMGGMTIMALAELAPQLFEDRIWGVALIGTSAGEVGKRGLPRPLLSRYNPVTRNLGRLADWRPGVVEFVRAAGGGLTRRAVRSLAFGGRDVPPEIVDFTMEMLDANPVRVLADFIETLGTHNRYAALAGLKHTRVLVLSGDEDRMTAFSHAERIAFELPDAELVRVHGAGHMVMVEQPQLVNDHLVMLLQQCAYGRDNGPRRWWRRG